MSAFSTSIALFVNRANSRAAALAILSVDAYIYGKEKLGRKLVRDVYHLDGGIRAVGTDSTLTPSQQLKIAQSLTKCYSLDKQAFIEGAPYSTDNSTIILQYGERILSYTLEGDFYYIRTTLREFSAPASGGVGGGDGTFDQNYVVSLSGGKTFGKYTSGQTIPTLGKNSREVMIDAWTEYLSPAFTFFSITGQASLIQVGTTLSGNKTFVWTNTNNANVQVNSIAVRDVTANVLIGSSLADDDEAILNIGTISNAVPISQSWRAEGVNTNSQAFVSSPYTLTSIYPVFFGKVSSGGAVSGVNRPVANQALIDSGTEVLVSAAGTLTFNFNSTADDYFWFAVPASSPTKTTWYVTALNTGSIGGAVNPGGNLFPAPDTVSVDSPEVSPLWTAVSYEIYITNYQSDINVSMEIRN